MTRRRRGNQKPTHVAEFGSREGYESWLRAWDDEVEVLSVATSKRWAAGMFSDSKTYTVTYRGPVESVERVDNWEGMVAVLMVLGLTAILVYLTLGGQL